MYACTYFFALKHKGISSNLSYKIDNQKQIALNGCEKLRLDIKLPTNHTIIIGMFYHHQWQNTIQFINILKEKLTNLHTIDNNYYLFGDLNTNIALNNLTNLKLNFNHFAMFINNS